MTNSKANSLLLSYFGAQTMTIKYYVSLWGYLVNSIEQVAIATLC